VNFLSRAFTSMTRNPLKTLLLLLIAFVLGIVISGAISVQQAIQNTDTILRQKLPLVASIEIDYEAWDKYYKLTGEWDTIGFLPLETLSEIGNLPYVRNYNLSAGALLSSRELDSTDETTFVGEGGWRDFSIIGVPNAEFVDIEEGLIEIISGRTFTEQEATTLSYVALISEELASLNGLHIGSNFSLDNIIWDMRGRTVIEPSFFVEENIYMKRSYDFEVVGIFKSHANISTGDEHWNIVAKDGFLSGIYVPNPVAFAANRYFFEGISHLQPEWYEVPKDNDSTHFGNVYVLNELRDIESFRYAAENKLPDFWKVVDLQDSFDDVAPAMETLRNIASLVLRAAIGAAIAILSLLIILLLRERKREIGVYLALGESKARVIFQILTETLAVSLIAISLSLFAGAALSHNISETMLRNEIEASQELTHYGESAIGGLDLMGFPGSGVTSAEEVIAVYDVSLTATTVTIFYATAIATVLIATILPMLYIVRLNPKKIML